MQPRGLQAAGQGWLAAGLGWAGGLWLLIEWIWEARLANMPSHTLDARRGRRICPEQTSPILHAPGTAYPVRTNSHSQRYVFIHCMYTPHIGSAGFSLLTQLARNRRKLCRNTFRNASSTATNDSVFKKHVDTRKPRNITLVGHMRTYCFTCCVCILSPPFIYLTGQSWKCTSLCIVMRRYA